MIKGPCLNLTLKDDEEVSALQSKFSKRTPLFSLFFLLIFHFKYFFPQKFNYIKVPTWIFTFCVKFHKTTFDLFFFRFVKMTIYTFGLGVPASPEYKGSWGHGGLFTNQLNQKSRKRHDSTLGHSPSGLYHNKILVSYVWWTMQPHVWRHVSHHIAKTVEASHSELKQKSTKDWEGTENGHICARNWRGECKSHSEKKKETWGQSWMIKG